MANNKWRYLINPFEVNTRGSHVKGLSLAADHDAKLHAEDSDPDILALYTAYHLVYQAYATICSHYDSVAGIRKGLTVSLQTLLVDDLPEQLRVWEGVVHAVHPEDTPQEVMIFPNKRSPFLQGTYEDRIGAINSLIENLTANGGFATLVTQVQSFYNLALSTRNTQQQQEGLIGQSSDLRENQRLLVMQEMHGNLGMLIHKFRADIDQVERFFDMSKLRETGGDVVIEMLLRTVGSGSYLGVGALPAGTEKVRLTLLANGPIEMGLSVDGLTYNGNTTSTAAINAPVTYTISDFASAGNILLLHNQNPMLPTDCKIEFLE